MSERIPTVFVVDDDDSIRKSLVRLLKSMGYPARPYASAREFLDDWRHNPTPGCLVLDVQLPELSGLELELLGHGADDGVHVDAALTTRDEVLQDLLRHTDGDG